MHSTQTISGSKPEVYSLLLKQLVALTQTESDSIANISNAMSLLHTQFNWWWVGIYFVKDKQLVLGPFQGPVACTRIDFGKGVCGRAWERAETLIVPDVEKFPGHIACSAASKSEIVVPVFKNNQVVAVLDVDSEHLAHFDERDKDGLESIARLLSTFL